MKIKKPKETTALVRSRITEIKRNHGQAEVWHSQSIKQSHNFQSADCCYGAKIVVADEDVCIQQAVKRLEKLIEKPMTAKFRQQQQLLANLK